MSRTLREPEILSLARRDGRVTVESLAAHFGVTLQTIRRDLTDLADKGLLQRAHGGAVLPPSTANIDYPERRALYPEAKAAIAKACAADIPNGSSIFLNLGTTTEAVAQALCGHEGLMVVTNNLNIATILAEARGTEVIVTGGTQRAGDRGLVGPVAEHAIKGFRFDFAIIGCSAVHERGDILDFDQAEISVSQTAIGQSDSAALVVDASKFGRRAPVRIAALSDMRTVYSDAPLPARCADLCGASGTVVKVAEAASDPNHPE